MQVCILRIDNGVPIPMSIAVAVFLFPSNPGLLKDGRERSTATVGGIRSTLTIVRDEPPNGHGLHGMCGDADRAAVGGSRDAKQNYPILRTERGRQSLHDLPR